MTQYREDRGAKKRKAEFRHGKVVKSCGRVHRGGERVSRKKTEDDWNNLRVVEGGGMALREYEQIRDKDFAATLYMEAQE